MPILTLIPKLGVVAPTGLPTLLIELDVNGWLIGPALDDPLTAQLDSAVLGPVPPTFGNDISPYFRSGDTHRGAQRELQRVEAGTASLTLNNRDGRFTPFNIASPYYPNVLPMRRIRIRAVWDNNTYPVYYGFVEGWPVTFNDTDTTTQVSLVDGFKILSLAFVSGDFPQQGSGARVQAILEIVGWLTAETDIDVGTVTVPAVTLDNVSALEHIQQIEHAEAGRFFIGRDGKAVFKDRTAQVNPDFTDRTWADDGTGMSYRDVVIVCDDELILNDVHLTRDGGVEQVASDLSSQNEYGIRSSAETGIQLSDDTQVSDRADVTLLRYSQPVQRLAQLIDDAMQHNHWDRVLARELNDYALAIETRTATAQVSSIEGISHSWPPNEWWVTLDMSPTVVEQAGILDDSTYGLLDSTAILAR
jgi:hypothetical protein